MGSVQLRHQRVAPSGETRRGGASEVIDVPAQMPVEGVIRRRPQTIVVEVQCGPAQEPAGRGQHGRVLFFQNVDHGGRGAMDRGDFPPPPADPGQHPAPQLAAVRSPFQDHFSILRPDRGELRSAPLGGWFLTVEGGGENGHHKQPDPGGSSDVPSDVPNKVPNEQQSDAQDP